MTNIDLVIGRKRKVRKTRNELGKGNERVMKQKNLTPDGAVKRQIWRKVTENRCNTGKLLKIDSIHERFVSIVTYFPHETLMSRI